MQYYFSAKPISRRILLVSLLYILHKFDSVDRYFIGYILSKYAMTSSLLASTMYHVWLIWSTEHLYVYFKLQNNMIPEIPRIDATSNCTLDTYFIYANNKRPRLLRFSAYNIYLPKFQVTCRRNFELRKQILHIA